MSTIVIVWLTGIARHIEKPVHQDQTDQCLREQILTKLAP